MGDANEARMDARSDFVAEEAQEYINDNLDDIVKENLEEIVKILEERLGYEVRKRE